MGKRQSRRKNFMGWRSANRMWSYCFNSRAFGQTSGVGSDRLRCLDNMEEGEITMVEKIKNIGNNLKELGKKICAEVGSKIKGAVKSIKGLNPFKK